MTSLTPPSVAHTAHKLFRPTCLRRAALIGSIAFATIATGCTHIVLTALEGAGNQKQLADMRETSPKLLSTKAILTNDSATARLLRQDSPFSKVLYSNKLGENPSRDDGVERAKLNGTEAYLAVETEVKDPQIVSGLAKLVNPSAGNGSVRIKWVLYGTDSEGSVLYQRDLTWTANKTGVKPSVSEARSELTKVFVDDIRARMAAMSKN